MDRHHLRHRKARVGLPLSVPSSRLAAVIQITIRRRRVKPAITAAMGLASFVTGGVAVVATASVLALQL